MQEGAWLLYISIENLSILSNAVIKKAKLYVNCSINAVVDEHIFEHNRLLIYALLKSIKINDWA